MQSGGVADGHLLACNALALFQSHLQVAWRRPGTLQQPAAAPAAAGGSEAADGDTLAIELAAAGCGPSC